MREVQMQRLLACGEKNETSTLLVLDEVSDCEQLRKKLADLIESHSFGACYDEKEEEEVRNAVEALINGDSYSMFGSAEGDYYFWSTILVMTKE